MSDLCIAVNRYSVRHKKDKTLFTVKSYHVNTEIVKNLMYFCLSRLVPSSKSRPEGCISQ